MKKYFGIIVDVINSRQIKGELVVSENRIVSIRECEHDSLVYILPGFIDAHVHIESSMTIPSSFSKMVVAKGTVAVVSDPHEIANVMGVEGVNFMIEDAKNTPLKVFYGVPSCVPATSFETSGHVLDSDLVDELLGRDDLYFLSEMMNFPGVIHNAEDVMQKIKSAHKHGKVIDGHAPGVRGSDLEKYIKAGISTDHECFSYQEAVEKIKLGMKILIREGSAAKNFDQLYALIDDYPDMVMLCTDDSHPDTLIDEGHIDKILKRGIEKGLSFYNILRAATVNPVFHYGLNVGLLRVGDPADFIIVDNLEDFNILQTVIEGNTVFENNKVLFSSPSVNAINNFCRTPICNDDIKLIPEENKIRVITVQDGDLITGQIVINAKIVDGNIVSDIDEDILKMIVLSRYDNSKIQIGFIKGVGLKKGAIASSIAHDSHNIIAVGASDEDLVAVVNKLIRNKGGIVIGSIFEQFSLELEVAGLMTRKDGGEVVSQYNKLVAIAKEFGSILDSPFMTLAFMSLLVIPELKLGDKGLFDVNKFEFVDVFVKE